MKEVALFLKIVCHQKKYCMSTDLALVKEILPALEKVLQMDDDDIIGKRNVLKINYTFNLFNV